MNLPIDFINRMQEMLSKDDFDKFIESFNNESSYQAVRVNQKKNINNVASELLKDNEKVLWCNDGYYISKEMISGKHPYHIAGMLYFQEPSAMSTVEAMDIQEDDYILDLCASPGGKTTQAGSKLSKDGLLISNEIIPKRAKVLSENIERFGFSNTIVLNENPENLADRFNNFFDKIIVDAPCSGEGMFKKEPQAITEWSINHTLTCATRQKHIMDCAYKMLKSGGIIGYSTCTFAPCENEGVIDYMLSTYDDLELVETNLDMLSCGNGEFVSSKFDLSKCRRVFPHKNKGEGHFVAVLKKQGNRQTNEKLVYKTDKKVESALILYKEFEKDTLNVNLNGKFELFGDNLYLIPHGIDLNKLRVERAGLYLGVIKKNRFEPAHHLLKSLNKEDFKNSISFNANNEILLSYLKGNVIECDKKGYVAVCVDGCPIGWGKASNGILKNHFPKYLRLL